MKTKFITLLIVLSFCSGITAQTNDEQARQKYMQAKEAYNQEKYNFALSFLIDAKFLLGKTNVRIQPMMAKCFAKLENWYAAKNAIKNYYALNPDKSLVEYAEMVELEKETDKHLTIEEVNKINAQMETVKPETKPEVKSKPVVISKSKTIAKSETETETDIYTVVEKMPMYAGGEDSLFAFLGRNMKYPVVAQENGIQGKVVARFVVQKDGGISDVEIIRSLDPACDKEVIRLVKSLPKWTPGRQNGKLVPVWYTLPIVFKLQ